MIICQFCLMRPYFEFYSFIETIVDALLIVEGFQVLHVQFPKAPIQIVLLRFSYGCRAASPPLKYMRDCMSCFYQRALRATADQ